MMPNKLFLLALILFNLAASAGLWAQDEPRACRGGDGGIPMSDISSQIGVNQEVLSTKGLVSDFVYWEKKNTIVYRTENHEVWANNLNNKTEYRIGSLSAPLAHLTDPKERFLTTEGNVQIIDTLKNPASSITLKFAVPLRKLLFWGNDTLFGITSHRIDLYQQLNFFSYRHGSERAHSCLLPVEAGESFELAEGHRYPFAFMFKQTPTPQGVELSLYRVYLEGVGTGQMCQLQYMKTYLNRLPAKVKMVYQFPDWNAFAVSLDHPTQNLLWDYGPQCIYYNLNNSTPIVTNFKEPLIMTWDGPQGLGILSPIRGQSVHVLKGWTHRNVASRQLWMTADGKKVIAGVQPEGHEGRFIFQIKLNKLP